MAGTRLGGTIIAALVLAGCTLLVDTSGLSGETADASSPDGSTNGDATTDGGGGGADGTTDPTGEGGDVDAGRTNPPCETDSELKLCLRFEDNTTDESPSNAAPKASSGLVYEAGRHGKAAKFGAGGSISDLTYASTLFGGAKTIEVWVKPASTSRMVVADVRDDFALLVEGGKVICRQPELASTASIPLNEWSHVACVTDLAVMRAYVNGSQSNSAVSTNATDNNADTGIGQDSPTGGTRFEGSMDDLRIWTTTRTAPQIMESATR